MNVPIIVILVVQSLLLISCIIFLILHMIKFRKYVNKYNAIWNKFENKDLEKDIEMLIHNMEESNKISQDAKLTSEVLEEKMVKSLQKVGFVKYDAYEKNNNGLSFALALLDAKDYGILINSIYTRNGSNIYAKQVINGECDGSISEEEQKAIQIAKNSKTFM